MIRVVILSVFRSFRDLAIWRQQLKATQVFRNIFVHFWPQLLTDPQFWPQLLTEPLVDKPFVHFWPQLLQLVLTPKTDPIDDSNL